MPNLEWLLNGDYAIKRKTKKYLFDEKLAYSNQGFIGRYLNLYDATTKLWGNGHYGPKWISTNLTLLELKYLEIDPNNLIYQESLINY